MNERIKELMEQAVKDVDIVTGDELLDDELSKMYIPDCFAEKFAELIVKECMLINRQRLFADFEGDSHRVAHNNALWCAVSDMQEHFGVEE